MGFIARCRLSSIVNTSVSYLTFRKKKKSNKNKKTNSSSPSSSQKYHHHHPPANLPRKLPDSTHHHTKDIVKKVIPKKVIPKKDIDLEKQFAKERIFADEKECLWLSTDRPSTNAYFEQCRSSLSHFLLDERLNVWLSRSSISKVTEWLSRPSATKAADWLTRASLSKEDESFILGRDLPSEEAEILMLTSSASNVSKSTKVEDLDQDGLNMMVSLVNLDDTHRSSISGTALLEGSDGEPLFWPFELKFEMDGDEQVGYFCMSPRKDIVAKVDSKGRIEFPKLTKRNSIISSSSCAKLVALSLEGGGIPIEKILSFKRDWLGREDISFSDQVPIENMLGLGEFDGHEGLADEDTFSLDGSFLIKN